MDGPLGSSTETGSTKHLCCCTYLFTYNISVECHPILHAAVPPLNVDPNSHACVPTRTCACVFVCVRGVCGQVDLVKARELIDSKVVPAMRRWKVDLSKIVHGVSGLGADRRRQVSKL